MSASPACACTIVSTTGWTYDLAPGETLTIGRGEGDCTGEKLFISKKHLTITANNHNAIQTVMVRIHTKNPVDILKDQTEPWIRAKQAQAYQLTANDSFRLRFTKTNIVTYSFNFPLISEDEPEEEEQEQEFDLTRHSTHMSSSSSSRKRSGSEAKKLEGATQGDLKRRKAADSSSSSSSSPSSSEKKQKEEKEEKENIKHEADLPPRLRYSLAFPSISTDSECLFPAEAAAYVAVSVVSYFLKCYHNPDLRLVLVC